MIRKIGFHTLLVNDWRKEWQEEQRHKRKVALAAGIDPEVINKRAHFMLRNASLFFEDTSNDKFSRLTVLVDSTRKNYMPRKILFSLGYTQLRKCDGKRPILVGRDENLIPVMVLVDVQKNLDERGYPVPYMNDTRAHMLQELSNTFVDEHRGVSHLRVDHVSLPADFQGKAILKLTCKRGMYWAEGHSEEELRELWRYKQRVRLLREGYQFDFVFGDEEEFLACMAS